MFTTFPEPAFTASEVLRWYRTRWQVGPVFRRFRSPVQLGRLPEYDDESAEARPYGKLPVALLAEKPVRHAVAVSPWGYHLETAKAARSVARLRVRPQPSRADHRTAPAFDTGNPPMEPDPRSVGRPRVADHPNWPPSSQASIETSLRSCPPLKIMFFGSGEPRPEHFRIAERPMGFADDERTVLRINEHIALAGIPAEAHDYQVNGRIPLEWLIDRYRIARDKESGIVNDPNARFEDPRELVATIRRAVHISVETVRIVAALPDPLADG